MHVAASVFSNSDRTFGDAMNKYLPVYKGQGYRHTGGMVRMQMLARDIVSIDDFLSHLTIPPVSLNE